METHDPSNRNLHTQYRVWFIEKLIINFALPSDLVFHTWRAFREHDHSQSVLERVVAMWKGKNSKFQKLLRLKDENGGTIPEDYQTLCRHTRCGKTRLYLAMGSWRNPRASRRKNRRGKPATMPPTKSPPPSLQADASPLKSSPLPPRNAAMPESVIAESVS